MCFGETCRLLARVRRFPKRLTATNVGRGGGFACGRVSLVFGPSRAGTGSTLTPGCAWISLTLKTGRFARTGPSTFEPTRSWLPDAGRTRGSPRQLHASDSDERGSFRHAPGNRSAPQGPLRIPERYAC